MRSLAWAPVLAAIYVTLLGATTPAHWLVGLVLGAVVSVAVRERRATHAPATWRRVVASPRFVGAWALAMARGTWRTLRALARRRVSTHLVEVPVGERSKEGVALSALVASSTPGSIFVEEDAEREVIVLDELDTIDPETSPEEHQRFYERHQKRVLP